MKTIYSFIISAILLFCVACKKDFLNRLPQDVLSTTGALASPDEMAKYLNQFYPIAFNVQPGSTLSAGIAYDDQYSDNIVPTISTSLLAGTRSLSNAVALSDYVQIRNVNFMIANFGNCKGDETLKRNYQGEAYFFRAWFHFRLVKSYGNVTWVNKVLPPDQDLMKVGRDSRLMVVDSILADLNKAAILMQAQSNSATMRVHKDVVLAFKSKVALYEGTWQRYHKALNTPFYSKEITDPKITNYLEQARDAAYAVIQSNRWGIYSTGKPLVDYQNLFITTDLSTNKEILLWRKYNALDKIAHSVTRYLNNGGGDLGISGSLVDEYLTRTGQLFVGVDRDNAQKIYGIELDPTIRDPRLAQTVAMPGVRLKPLSASNPFNAPYPPLNTSGFNHNSTGYSMLKYIEMDNVGAVTNDNASEAPAIQFRYSEILLNYAEALAELGGSPIDIANALKPLRDRVGMPAVDFDREYNSDPSYPFSSLSKQIQVVRRERRVELACEGTRMDDLFRWAAMDKVIVGKYPLGVLFVGSDFETANKVGGWYEKNNYFSGRLFYDGNPGGSINLWLTGIPGDAKRYVSPYKANLPAGWGFKLNRDYLSPIQQRQLTLTGGKWIQNPGW